MFDNQILNIFSMLILLCLLVNTLAQKKKGDKTSEAYSLMLYFSIFYQVANFCSDLADGRPSLRWLGWVAAFFTFLCVDFLVIGFSLYLKNITGIADPKWEKIMNPAVLFTYIRILLVIVLGATGKLFTLDENNRYQDADLCWIPYVLTVVVLLMLSLVVSRHSKKLTRRQLIVMYIYITLPIPCVVLELLTDQYVYTGIAVTLSVLLVYLVIQSDILRSAELREKVLEDVSSTDLLTKINNRRAYYNRLSVLDDSVTLGVFFCDINGLKYTNDNFGHSEGDKLIIRFARVLDSFFDARDVFRISGDEFVALVPGLTQAAFDEMVEKFEIVLVENNFIAAMGPAYGRGGNADKLIAEAEQKMYTHKRSLYRAGQAIDSRNAELKK